MGRPQAGRGRAPRRGDVSRPRPRWLREAALRRSKGSGQRAGRIALIVSVVGLLGTNAWSFAQFSQQNDQIEAQQDALAAQKEQIGQAREELALARGRLTLTANMMLFDEVADEWTSSIDGLGKHRGEEFASETFDRHTVWTVLRVVNTGTAAADLLSAGFVLVGDGQLHGDHDGLRCTDPSTGQLSRCDFPLRIEAQGAEHIWVAVEPVLEWMTCNDVVAQRGVVAGVRTVDGTVIQAETATKITQSEACPLPTTEQTS